MWHETSARTTTNRPRTDERTDGRRTDDDTNEHEQINQPPSFLPLPTTNHVPSTRGSNNNTSKTTLPSRALDLDLPRKQERKRAFLPGAATTTKETTVRAKYLGPQEQQHKQNLQAFYKYLGPKQQQHTTNKQRITIRANYMGPKLPTRRRLSWTTYLSTSVSYLPGCNLSRYFSMIPRSPTNFLPIRKNISQLLPMKTIFYKDRYKWSKTTATKRKKVRQHT